MENALGHYGLVCAKDGGRNDRRPRRARFLTELELKRLEEALRQQEQEKPSTGINVNAIRFLLHTGFRINEALNLKWEDVFLGDGYVSLVGSKVGHGVRPLSGKAVSLLSSVKREGDNPYVFHSQVPGKPLAGIEATWKEIINRAGLKGLRISDLRHSYGAFEANKGVDRYAVSKLLGYKCSLASLLSGSMEQGYLGKAADQASTEFS